MSWVTILCSMTGAACLTLASVNLVLWFRARSSRSNLIFGICALATVGAVAFDLLMLHAQTPAQFGELLRWIHVPVWVMVISLAWFCHFYLGAGRTWLLWLVCGIRTLALVLNFVLTPNLNFREITALRQIRLLGETVSTPVGVVNPWTLVGQASMVLLLIYVVDSSVMAWRKGSRSRALAMGSAVAIALAGSVAGSVLALWFHAPTPYLVGVLFVMIVVVMAYELSGDVQRSVQLSRELHESRERMSLAVVAADIAMWEWNVAQDLFWTSDRCRTRQVLEKSERLDYKRFLQLLHPEDREAVSQGLKKAMSGDGNYEGEHRVLLPDGEVRWITAAGKVEFDAAHRPLVVRGISMDVTRLKQAELEIRNQRDELARLSRVAMLGELSGSLAHEIIQPLGAILTNAQTAQLYISRAPPDLNQVREILADIVEADERAVEMMRRLRLLFRQGTVQTQQLDLNELVREVLKMVRSDIATRKVSLTTELADLPEVDGDRVQLQQVLLNLLFNACDAMANFQPETRNLVLRTGVSPDEGIRVTVADRGCGIPADSLKRIFDAFYTTKPNGMGFGLSVCRSIITAHRGKLWAENNPDGGASFHFMLPVRGAKEPVGEYGK